MRSILFQCGGIDGSDLGNPPDTRVKFIPHVELEIFVRLSARVPLSDGTENKRSNLLLFRDTETFPLPGTLDNLIISKIVSRSGFFMDNHFVS